MFSQPFDPSPRARQAAANPEAQPLNLAQQPRHMLRYLLIDDTPYEDVLKSGTRLRDTRRTTSLGHAIKPIFPEN